MPPLCKPHHANFDHYQFTFVERKENEFVVCATPETSNSGENDVRTFIGRSITFKEKAPLPHFFLVKQLGKFKVQCIICDKSFTHDGVRNHLKKHGDIDFVDAERKSKLRPIICNCGIEKQNLSPV